MPIIVMIAMLLNFIGYYCYTKALVMLHFRLFVMFCRLIDKAAIQRRFHTSWLKK